MVFVLLYFLFWHETGATVVRPCFTKQVSKSDGGSTTAVVEHLGAHCRFGGEVAQSSADTTVDPATMAIAR